MPDVKISAGADPVTLVATDRVPMARSASTTAYAATMAEISSWANTQLPVASTSISGTVKVDGTTITIASGVISSAAAPLPSSSLPAMDGTAAPGTATAWSRGDHVHPSDTAKAPLASPTFTGTPAAPTPTTGDNTTRIATTAFVQSQMVASGAGVSTWNTRAGAVVLQQGDITAVGALNDTGRNLIQNPTMTVAQRGTGPWTTSGVYTADRWQIAFVGGTLSAQVNALADAARVAIGDEAARSSLGVTLAGTSGAGDFACLQHPIEGVSRISGKTVTLSFWAVAASGAPKLGLNFYQNFGSGGSPSGSVVVTAQTVTLSTTWARYTATYAIPSIAGKTLGTNGGDFLLFRVWLSSGATNNAEAGNIGVQSGTIQLWGIQLEIGSVVTPLAKREYAEELRACQRFYWVGYVKLGGPGTAGVGNTYAAPFPVTMRAAPTITPGTPISNVNTGSPTITSSGNSVFILNTTPSTTSGMVYENTFIASADL